MQQPDYTSAPYYPNYPISNPNNPNPNSPNYASAPPFNYPPTPQFPLIPDPTPNPQFNPPPVYPPPDPYPNYPQSGPYDGSYNQFGSTRVDSGLGHAKFDQFGSNQVDSGSGYVKLDQFGPTRVDSGSGYAKFDQFGSNQANSGSGYVKLDQFGPTRVESGSGYAKLDQFGPTRVDSGSGYAKFDQYGPTRVDSDHGYPKYDQPGLIRVDSGPGYSNFDKFGPTRVDSGSGHAKFDQFGGGYGASGPDPSPNYAKYDQYVSTRPDSGPGQGVYAYQGSKTEPYGARGTGSWGGGGSTKVESGSGFDDFGRPIGSGKGSAAGGKVVRAVPKAESREDVSGGVQKFRVKLLAESGGQTTMDVLCQIGLDGIRMLDPATSRTLRIYPLDTVTRFEVLDSSIFAFWAKSPVDIEPRRIRLKSNSYTSGTILDIVTAATIQFKEIGGRSRPSEILKPAEQQPPEKKKGLGDWMNIIKPGNEEKDHWVPDEAVAKCTSCGTDFGAFVRRHHCRNCGDIFCDKCTHGRIALTAEENAQAVRVCDRCLAEVTHRLNIAKESSNRSSAGLQTHEDLAKKLQEEMERNRRSSSAGSRSDGSGRRMKEVACPTCTVHLQVQVPSSGSETIECGVCQHPFLVSSR